MDIKNILQSTIAQIKASEEREVQLVKDRVMREKIIPYNQELDQARQKAASKPRTIRKGKRTFSSSGRKEKDRLCEGNFGD